MPRFLSFACITFLFWAPTLTEAGAPQEAAPPPKQAAPSAAATPSGSATVATPPSLMDASCDCVTDRHGPWQSAWATVGYTRWWISDAPFATPLATTGTGPNAGVLGDPATVALFGDRTLDYGGFNGLRFDAGLWVNDAHTIGIGGGYSTFDRRTSTFFTSSDTLNFITRPYFNQQTFQNVVAVVADTAGGLNSSLGIRNIARFDSLDLHLLRNLVAGEGLTVNAIFGYRYFNLRESLDIRQDTAFDGDGISPLIVAGNPVTSLTIGDSFHTQNRVQGVELGLRGEIGGGAFFANATAKVTLGVNQQRVDISGVTSGTGETAVSFPSGLLAVGDATFPGNLGSHHYNQFIIMPEFGLQAGLQISSHARIFLGYDLLYLNDVVRPGSQIEPVINPRYVPSDPAFGIPVGFDSPRPTRARNDFFAHGVSIGIEFQY